MKKEYQTPTMEVREQEEICKGPSLSNPKWFPGDW